MEVKKGGLEEDHQSSSLKEKIVNRKKPIHLFILNGIDAFFVFGFVKVLGYSLMIENFFPESNSSIFGHQDGVGPSTE